MTLVPSPDVDCPKCGRVAAFHGVVPRYHATDETGRDGLEWACDRCGYVLCTPPLDRQGGVIVQSIEPAWPSRQ